MASRTAAPAATTTVATTTPNQRQSLVAKMASKYAVDPDKMLATLKATAFASEKEVSNEQLMALLVVADQYNLNPWTKEIYAFPTDAKKGGIVPIVGIDGWIRMINERPELVSIDFRYPHGTEDDEIPAWIECVIVRRDRESPTVIREYYAECKRNTGPWQSHPRRMLRHKTLIQCARVAFGYGGIYDPDEGERVLEAINVTPAAPQGKPATLPPRATPSVSLANEDQLELIREALSKSNVSDGELFDRFEVEKLEELKFDDVNDVLAWINDRAN